MRSLSLSLLLTASLAAAGLVTAADLRRSIKLAGQLEDQRLVEVSGLVSSGRDEDLLWMLNDGGAEPVLHATDLRGRTRGELVLETAHNRDWEDLAAFELDGTPFLVAADIGDNFGRRDALTLYFVAEPAQESGGKLSAKPAWSVDFSYPDGARDAESVAVDPDEERVYVLSKRDLPPRLYSLPLRAPETQTAKLTARYLGPVNSLPAPPEQDIAAAGRTLDWHWQPTAMDFSGDGRYAAILTYRAVYLYPRKPGQSWYDALSAQPHRYDIGGILNAESMGFAADGRSVLITVERLHAPLFQVDLKIVPVLTQPEKAGPDDKPQGALQ
ncbi:MAG: hypothetical protein AAGE85_04580 [Pseudomonadota bacterium]